MKLDNLRAKINKVDDELVRLLKIRFALTDKVGEMKRRSGAKVLDAKREAEVLSRIADKVSCDLGDDIKACFKSLMARSRARQNRLIACANANAPKVVGIRGMGLIGGSFQKAFLSAGSKVINLKDDTKIKECDLVIVALPPSLVVPWIKAHQNAFKRDAIITDAAGTKATICKALAKLSKKVTYIGGHPMAGKERSGYANSESTLFVGASMILTPYKWTPKAKLESLKKMLAVCGFGGFTIVEPKVHDEMIAYTSQLAHIVSSAYVQDKLAQVHAGFSAGSFQDMTRVATIDPEVWTDLFRLNEHSLVRTLARLIARLKAYKVALKTGNDKKLKSLLEAGRKAKERSR